MFSLLESKKDLLNLPDYRYTQQFLLVTYFEKESRHWVKIYITHIIFVNSNTRIFTSFNNNLNLFQ